MTRPAKGFKFLVQALQGLAHLPDVLLLTVGGARPSIRAPIPNLHLDSVGNERFLSLIYSAADVAVVPSLQDNFPQVALEAMACGTPVVAFAVGGLLDIVRPGVTGVLVPSRDATGLDAAIAELLQDPAKRTEMAANCQQVVANEYAVELQARRHLALYEAITLGRTGAAAQDERGVTSS
jgi:glycosyltransferase involved in cell wall biosynthesis